MLETPRLILRRWKSSDLDPFSRMNANPQVMRFFPKLLNKSETEKLVSRIQDHWNRYGFGLFAVEEKSGGNFIGFTGQMYTDFPSHFTPAVEIGWRLDHRYWGKGYAKEAALECLGFSFRELKIPEIVSFTSRINHPSRGVMRGIGLVYSGEFEHPRVPIGHRLRTHVLFRTTGEELNLI